MFFLNFNEQVKGDCKVYLVNTKEEKLEGINAVDDDAGEGVLQALFQEDNEEDDKKEEEQLFDNFNSDLDLYKEQ